MMSSLLPTSAIFVATDPVDLRKAFDGLATLVRQSLGQDPLSGSVYIFSNRQRNRLKVLFWEPNWFAFPTSRILTPCSSAKAYPSPNASPGSIRSPSSR
jgi:transposase